MLKFLLRFLKVDEYIRDIVTTILISLLTRLSEMKDEDIQEIERQMKAHVYAELSRLPKGSREIVRAAIEPVFEALFAALEQVNDVSAFVKKALERM